MQASEEEIVESVRALIRRNDELEEDREKTIKGYQLFLEAKEKLNEAIVLLYDLPKKYKKQEERKK